MPRPRLAAASRSCACPTSPKICAGSEFMRFPKVEAGAVDDRRREQQRCGLAGGAGDRQQDAGDRGRAGRSAARCAITTRQRGEPSASAASRRLSGTSSSTTSAERVTIGSISSDSATEPFQPAKPAAARSGEHQRDVDEQAEDDRRHARHHVDEVAHDRRELASRGRTRRGRGRRRCRSAPRSGWRGRPSSIVPEDGALHAARVAEEVAVRVGREEVAAPRAEALLIR